MCTAARSEICDRRRCGIHERRRSAMTPKERRYFGRQTRGQPGALPLAARTRRGRATRTGAGMPPGRQAVVAPSPALYADDVVQARDRRRARGARLHPQSRSVSAGFTVDEPKATLAMRSSYRRGTRPWGRDRRGVGAASPTADAAKRRSAARGDAAAKFFPVRRLRNLFLLSAHGHEAIMPACGDAKETKR